ncbi:hypothetical protein ACTFIY_012526 [Dictyostelium cf. discoideum]
MHISILNISLEEGWVILLHWVFLAEWDSFLSRITREEKEKYGINDEQAESLNIFNNSFGNPPTDAKENLLKKNHIPSLMDEFSSLLKAEFEKRSEVINKRLSWIKGSNLNLGENGYREGDQNDRKQLFKFYKSNLNSSKNSNGSSKPLITPLTSQNVTKILNRYVLNGVESLDDGERNYITDAHKE